MTIQIGAKPDAGFDDPLGMLKDCHRRVEHFLHILWTVSEHARARPLTSEEAAAVRASLQYFRIGGSRHTADEEQSLFPRMRAAAGPNTQVDGLEHDHRVADDLHEILEALYAEWLSSGVLPAAQEARLRTAASQLKDHYAEHIRLEEEVVFPRAAELLTSDALAEVGREFQQRRA